MNCGVGLVLSVIFQMPVADDGIGKAVCGERRGDNWWGFLKFDWLS